MALRKAPYTKTASGKIKKATWSEPATTPRWPRPKGVITGMPGTGIRLKKLW